MSEWDFAGNTEPTPRNPIPCRNGLVVNDDNCDDASCDGKRGIHFIIEKTETKTFVFKCPYDPNIKDDHNTSMQMH